MRQQDDVRSFLRILGPIILGMGGLCLIIGMASFFMAFGGGGPPRLFWMCFLGMPMIAIGIALCKFGYMGAVARFVAGETMPVAVDSVNYAAAGTKDAVETVARSVSKGIASGVAAAGQEAGSSDVNFCPQCGGGLKADYRFCPKCGRQISTT
jgi:hypothetical protein